MTLYLVSQKPKRRYSNLKTSIIIIDARTKKEAIGRAISHHGNFFDKFLEFQNPEAEVLELESVYLF